MSDRETVFRRRACRPRIPIVPPSDRRTGFRYESARTTCLHSGPDFGQESRRGSNSVGQPTSWRESHVQVTYGARSRPSQRSRVMLVGGAGPAAAQTQHHAAHEDGQDDRHREERQEVQGHVHDQALHARAASSTPSARSRASSRAATVTKKRTSASRASLARRRARRPRRPPIPTPNACQILNLDAQPINLNLLGLRLRTNQIELRIDARPGRRATCSATCSAASPASSTRRPRSPATPSVSSRRS